MPDDDVDKEPTLPEKQVTTQGRWLNVARVGFVIAVLIFGVWGLSRHWTDITTAIASIPAGNLALAVAFLTIGIVPIGPIWRQTLHAYGYPLPARVAYPIFFVGQLGKYIPGSVWSFGAQAAGARQYGVPARVTVMNGLVVLGAMIAVIPTVALPAALLGTYPTWTVIMIGVAALVGLLLITPPALNTIGTRVAGMPLRTTKMDLLRMLGWMVPMWIGNGLALYLLLPDGSAGIAVTTGVFAVAYAAGVLMVLAPAGIGAREAVLIALLAPYVGVPAAAAAALLMRAFTTVIDFAVAGVTYAIGRQGHPDSTPSQDG